MSALVVVVGDLLLDVDFCGDVNRVSPDAPVPVLSHAVSRRRPGGAGLTAALTAVDAETVLIAPVAADAGGHHLRELLAGRVRLLELPFGGTTSVKSRLRAGTHPLARFDTGGTPGPVGPPTDEALQALDAADTVLVSDYGCGMTRSETFSLLWSHFHRRRPVVWDPHPSGRTPPPGCTLVTPNLAEATAATSGLSGDDLGTTAERARLLRTHWSAQAVAVTVGAQGAVVATSDGTPSFFPATSIAAATDTCGAGDAFAAGAAVGLADGMLPSEAVANAVVVSSAFVAAGGAAGLSDCRSEPDDDPRDHRSLTSTLDDAVTRAEQVRARGGRVVATGGCFDLLHAGHVNTLHAARRMGDHLVVLLNSDDSVRRLKGSGRPLQSAHDRAVILRALDCVDAVAVFDDDDPRNALRRLRPDVWVKGGDYAGIELPETPVLAEWGGHAVTVPYVAGRSTTRLVARAHGDTDSP